MSQFQRILKQAEALFLRYGIKSITMDAIASDLGISKKTLYQHVENKTDLLQKVILQNFEEEQIAITAIRKESKHAIEEILRIGKHVVEQLREVSPTTIYDMQKYYKSIWDQMQGLHQQKVFSIIQENLKWGMEEGLYRSNLNAEIIAKLYVGKTALVVDEELFPSREYHREQLFEEYINYHIRGIASAKGLEVLKGYQEVRSEHSN